MLNSLTGNERPLLHPLLRLLLVCIPLLALYIGLQFVIHAAVKPVGGFLKPIALVLAFMLASLLLLMAYRRLIRKLTTRRR